MSAERPPEPALKGETEDDLETRFPPEGAIEDDLLTRFNRGGSLIVARAESLQWLQAECLRADAVVPTVLTARYRLHTGPVFGNLMAAFAADVAALRRGEPQRVRGDLLPDPCPTREHPIGAPSRTARRGGGSYPRRRGSASSSSAQEGPP